MSLLKRLAGALLNILREDARARLAEGNPGRSLIFQERPTVLLLITRIQQDFDPVVGYSIDRVRSMSANSPRSSRGWIQSPVSP